MKHSKASCGSFQDELEDYIKVQKARGLEPKTCFRNMREDYWESRGCREVEARARSRVFDQRLPAGAGQAYPRPCRLAPTEARLPQGLPQGLPARHPLSFCPFSRGCGPGPAPHDGALARPGRRQGRPRGSRRPEEGGGRPERHRRRRSPEHPGGPHPSAASTPGTKTAAPPGSPGEPRPRKEKRREDRKRRKGKKAEGPERTEEEMLWDQSILGF